MDEVGLETRQLGNKTLKTRRSHRHLKLLRFVFKCLFFVSLTTRFGLSKESLPAIVDVVAKVRGVARVGSGFSFGGVNDFTRGGGGNHSGRRGVVGVGEGWWG